jgi:hypothetical protein
VPGSHFEDKVPVPEVANPKIPSNPQSFIRTTSFLIEVIQELEVSQRNPDPLEDIRNDSWNPANKKTTEPFPMSKDSITYPVNLLIPQSTILILTMTTRWT